ncbi:MAG: hypothetical protein JWN70_3049 [Planctomycetaceae bacterium]|nr:hypothetical protein [Planctomycetaceae bacterium]
MARRKTSGEVNIGSDSFLDVIANIVGILIILIVIAGVRVSRAPVIKKRCPPIEETAVAELIVPQAPTQVPTEPEPEAESEPEFAEVTTPPDELTEKIQTAQTEIDRLESEAAANEAAKKELERRQAQGELRIVAGRNKLLKEKAVRETHVRGIAEMQALMAAQQKTLELLQAQFKDEQDRAPKVQKLKHRVTPISRVVIGDQVHFRLSGNKVSQVPIHDLLEAAMRQAKIRGADFGNDRSIYGEAGPIRGYVLQYKLEAIQASAAETARHGPGMVRIALTSFQLEPDPELMEETPDQALTRGSAFDLAIQTAEPGSTFTLWVYPDSFQLYRQLQNRLHESGITVAARPLPKGIPIAGSPDGSASAGQ